MYSSNQKKPGFTSNNQAFVSNNQGFVSHNQGFVGGHQGYGNNHGFSSNQGFVGGNHEHRGEGYGYPRHEGHPTHPSQGNHERGHYYEKEHHDGKGYYHENAHHDGKGYYHENAHHEGKGYYHERGHHPENGYYHDKGHQHERRYNPENGFHEGGFNHGDFIDRGRVQGEYYKRADANPDHPANQGGALPTKPQGNQGGFVPNGSQGNPAGKVTPAEKKEAAETLEIKEIDKHIEDFDEKSYFTLGNKIKPDHCGPINTDKVNFKFSEWYLEFHTIREKMTKEGPAEKAAISDLIHKVADIYGKKDVIAWLHLPLAETFSWTDYVRSYYKLVELPFPAGKNNAPINNASLTHSTIMNNLSEEALKLQRHFLMGVCFFYYQNTSHSLEEDATFDSFMKHEPYDHTRPHNWYKLPDYVSYSEALQIIWQKKKRVAEASQAKTKSATTSDFTKEESETLRKFCKVHDSAFSRTLSDEKDLKISYDLYSKCFDDLQNPQTIKPYSVEICYFYCAQYDLSEDFIWLKKATPNDNLVPHFRKFSCPPSLKWFSVYDLQKFLVSWKIYHKLTQDDNRIDTKKAFLEFSKQHGYQIPFEDHKYGIAVTDISISYQDTLLNYLEFFGEFVLTLAKAILHTGAIEQCYHICRVTNIASNPQNHQDLTHSAFMTKTSLAELLGVLMRYFNKEYIALHDQIRDWGNAPEKIPLPHFWVDEYKGSLHLSDIFHIWALNFPTSKQLVEAFKFFNNHNNSKLEPPAEHETFMFNKFIHRSQEGFMRSNFAPLLKVKSVEKLDLKDVHNSIKDFFIKVAIAKLAKKLNKKISHPMEVQRQDALSQKNVNQRQIKAFQESGKTDGKLAWIKKKAKDIKKKIKGGK